MSMVNRVREAWAALLGKPSQRESAAREEALTLRRRLDAMDLELKEARETIAVQRVRLDRLESVGPADNGNSLEHVFKDLAVPVSQLRMQASLMAGGRDITARSVMALASRVVEIAENHGLEPIGVTGQEAAFDPSTCQALNVGATFVAGQAVAIRIVGYRYNGRVLRRALVDSLPDE